MDKTVIEGNPATFSVTVSGTNLSYQWQKNGINIVGATSASYTTPATRLQDDDSTFRCIVSKPGCMSVISNSAILTVNAACPIVISVHPTPKTVTEGTPGTFSVTASGTYLTYQWQKNGLNIAGATSASYSTPATILSDSGATFKCVVSKVGCSSVISNSAALTVNAACPIVISVHPTAKTVTEGKSATFSVTATGSNLYYQWRKNGVNIPGATSATYTTPVTTLSDNVAKFVCIIDKVGCSSVTTNSALLTVNPACPYPITISSHPTAKTVTVGNPATFSVIAAGTNVTYQWQKNTLNIPGATLASYTIKATTLSDNGAIFRCILSSNGCSSVTTGGGVLTVNECYNPISIISQPTSQIVTEGNSATFTVSAAGTGFTYQWQRNDANVAGAINASYTIPKTTLADNNAKYRCIVSRSTCSEPSDIALLTVAEKSASIQSLINRAASGTMIVVGDGTYSETLDFGGQAVHLRSANGPEKTIIDPSSTGSGVIFQNGEDENSILEGFTIQNGFSSLYGGGIQVLSASPVIKNCIMKGNVADYGEGAGIYIESGSPRIENTLIVSNTGGGILLLKAPSVDIINCTVANNDGIDLFSLQSAATIKNAIFWNSKVNSFALYTSSVTVINSCIRSSDTVYPGFGNINEDPLFRGPEDFRLKPSSPCINSGSTEFILPEDLLKVKRPIEEAPDMGAYECRTNKTFVVGIENAEYSGIQDAIDNAINGDTIMVKDGTYTGVRNKNLNFKGKAIVLKSENGGANCIIDCENNGRGIVFDSGEDDSSQVIGFTIMRGNAYDDKKRVPGNGGGIYIGPNCSPKFLDVKVVGCIGSDGVQSIEYGGGMYICGPESYPSFQFCSFFQNGYGNTSYSSNLGYTTERIKKGGGGYIENDANPKMEWCWINENTAKDGGGGIFCSNASISLQHCFINKNCASDGRTGITSLLFGSGGGIYSDNSIVALIESSLTENQARLYGGGIYASKLIVIEKSRITHNTANGGGGLYLINSGDTNFSIINNSLFSHNQLVNNSNNSTYYKWGGAFFVRGDMCPYLRFCTITDNAANQGSYGGLYVDRPDLLSIHNSIIWGNAGKVTTCPTPQSCYEGVPATIKENRVYDSGSSIKPTISNSYVNNLNGLSTDSNYKCPIGEYNYIAKNPEFNDDSYYLTVESIGLIDKGAPIESVTVDLEGRPRQNPPDMGCFETPVNMAGIIKVEQQPFNSAVNRTQTAKKSKTGIVPLVVKASPANVTYQWYCNHSKISGATSSTYSSPNLKNEGVFLYQCAIELPGTPYSKWSDAACLIVNDLKIVDHPKSQVVKEGDDVIFTGSFIGVQPHQSDVVVQWYQRDDTKTVKISGSVNWNSVPFQTQVTIENISITQRIKSVWFDITTGNTVVTSKEATITMDTDQDTLPDDWEALNLFTMAYGANDDPDMDGVINVVEYQNGSNPNYFTPGEDMDGNGLSDTWEIMYLGKTGSDPKADPDGDHLTNKEEMDNGGDPNEIDPAIDSDRDGVSNYHEFLLGYDPANNDPALIDRPPVGTYYIYDKLGRVTTVIVVN